jgi:hypothetical protein
MIIRDKQRRLTLERPLKIEKERGQNDTVCICRAISEIASDNGGLATGKLKPQYAVGNHKTAGHVDSGGRDRDKAGQGAKRFWLLPPATSDPTRKYPIWRLWRALRVYAAKELPGGSPGSLRTRPGSAGKSSQKLEYPSYLARLA